MQWLVEINTNDYIGRDHKVVMDTDTWAIFYSMSSH